MRRVLAEGWLPAVVFATAAGIGLLVLARWPVGAEGWTAVAVVAGVAGLVTPPVWWAVVTRRGRPRPARGAAAGGMCGATVVAVFVLWTVVDLAAGNGNVTLGYALPFVIMTAMVGVPVGAGVLGVVGGSVGGCDAEANAAQPRGRTALLAD